MLQGETDTPDEDENTNPESPGVNKSNQEDLQLKKAIEILNKPASEKQKAAWGIPKPRENPNKGQPKAAFFCAS